MSKVTKLFNTKATSIDEENSAVTFTISDNLPDRMDECVDQASWDFTEYKSNPIVLWGHDAYEAESVLGSAEDLTVAKDGSHTNATLKFATDINPKAKMVYEMIKAGILRTVSVGFISGEQENQKDGTRVLKDNKLLEISVVPIPANPRAIALAYKSSGISQKDARWLVESMKRESALIEKQLNDGDETVKEKAMDADQLKQVLDAIEAVKTDVAAVKEDVTGIKSDVDTKLEALTTQVTELKPDENVDPAKGGKSDQPGAADDKLDLDAELTPEQEAEAREALGLESEQEAA